MKLLYQYGRCVSHGRPRKGAWIWMGIGLFALDRTPYPLTRVLSPFQGDTGRDGRLAGRRACGPYSLCRFKMECGLKLYTKICYNSLIVTIYRNKVCSGKRNEGKLWEVLYR